MVSYTDKSFSQKVFRIKIEKLFLCRMEPICDKSFWGINNRESPRGAYAIEKYISVLRKLFFDQAKNIFQNQTHKHGLRCLPDLSHTSDVNSFTVITAIIGLVDYWASRLLG